MNLQHLNEPDLISHLCADIQLLANLTGFAIDTAFPYPEQPYSHSSLLATNLPRSKLGLNPQERPGDIDILLLPLKNGALVREKIVAIEVKVIRQTQDKPSKNANSLGATQAYGLVRDGFPFVGLLHISLPEPSPADTLKSYPVFAFPPPGTPGLIDTGRSLPRDPFPLECAKRQSGRLAKLDLPEYLAYSSIALGLSCCRGRVKEITREYAKNGAKSPQTKISLLEGIDQLRQKEPHLFQEINWCSS